MSSGGRRMISPQWSLTSMITLSEIDPLERRFERDVDVSVLDSQLDQLQPKRALAEGRR